MGHKERPHLLWGMFWRGSSWPALVPEGPWTYSLVESDSESQSPSGEPARSRTHVPAQHTHHSQGQTPESQKAGQLKMPLLQIAKKPFIKTPINRHDKPHVRPSTFLKLTNALVHNTHACRCTQIHTGKLGGTLETDHSFRGGETEAHTGSAACTQAECHLQRVAA